MEGITMEWKIAFEIVGFLGGITAAIGLLLAPMFYLGTKIDALRKDMHNENQNFHGRLCALEERFLNFLTKKDEKK